jgi:hypothetical protein
MLTADLLSRALASLTFAGDGSQEKIFIAINIREKSFGHRIQLIFMSD